MATVHKLLHNLLAIEETTPYHCKIEASTETGHQSLEGDVIFQVENGSLTFNFFPEKDGLDLESHQLFAISGQENSETLLSITSQDFEYSVRILSLPHAGMMTVGLPINRYKVKGVVTAEYFGCDLAPLTSSTMWFNNLPEFQGTESLVYRSGVVKSHNDHETPMGFRGLGYIVLNARGWSVRLSEIPREKRDSHKERHICIITREKDTRFTAQELGAFLEDLLPFLSLTFGRDVRPSVAIGSGENAPMTKWGIINSGNTASYHVRNWYLLPSNQIDLGPIFQQFCELPKRIRKHWRKVIKAYIVSEEIASILRRYDIAETVSLSGLEGLTKSFISTYEQEIREQWLDNNIELKHPKDADGNRQGLKDAIKLVARRELGSAQLDGILEQITRLRNTTVHLDLKVEEDLENAYFRWENCQSLVEVILLATLGLKEIPNRTQPGKFEVMGKDMLWKQREEAINL